MARGGGIEIPITVDASDLPKARRQIEAFFKKVSKDAGKYSVIDVFSGGKRVGVGGVAGIKGMEKYWAHFAKGAKEIKKVEMALKHMSARVKNAEKATKHYAKALEMVTTGRQISASLTDQLIHFYKKAPQYMAGLVAEWNKYVVLLRDAKLTDKKRAEYEERKARAMKFILEDLGIEISGKERLKRLEKGLEGQLARTKKQYRDTLTYQQRALKVAEVKARWLRDARKVISDEKREYARLLFLHKQGLITEQQKIQLVKLSNELTARGVRLKMRETKEWRKIAKEARKITERRGLFPGGSLLNVQRLGWFVQLRGYWALYRVFGALTERLVDLDEATARAMRTTREAGVTYEDMSQRVEKAIKRVAAVTGATYRDVGEAQYQLTSAGLSAQEAFAGLNTVMKVAVLTETDVTAATKLVAGVYNNLKETLGDTVSATEAMQKIGSTLIYTWQNNQVELSELTAALNQSIQSGKQAGLSFNELAIVLGNLGTFMVRGGRGGRSLRNVFINLIRDAEKAKEIFHLTREELDISGPIDFIALFRKMSTQWKAMGKEANKFQQAMELVRRRAGEAFVAILEGWDRIEEQLEGVEEAHVSLEDEIVLLTSRYRTLGKVISAEFANLIDEHANYMNVVKKLGRIVVLTMKQIKASAVHRRPEYIKEAFGGDPAAMEEAAREFRAYMGLAKLEGYGPKSLMVNELRAAAEYLELMAAAARENADAFETMYIYQRKLKPADVLANFPGGFGDPFGVAGTVGEQERAKDLLWKKQRSVLEKEWMVLLNKEEGVYGRLLVAREKYQRQWKLFSRLTADTATEVRGQVLKDTQKAFSLVYRLEGELSRYIAKRAAQINKERRAADEATFQALRRGTERYIIEIVQKRHDIEMNKLKQRMAILNKLTSIERKRGLNALDTLKEELRITEERLLQDKLSISSAEKEIDAQRRLVEMLRAIEDPTEKQLQQMHEEEDRLFKLELALKDMGLAANLTFIELQELRRQLQEMQSPVEQIRAGFRRLQVQWEDQANDFEGLTVRMGTSFENNLSGALADWVDGTKNAKDAFRDFAETFLKEINRMIIQMIVAKALAVALGFATSGGAGGGQTYQGATPAGEGTIFISRAAGGILPHIKGFRSMSRGGVTGGPTVAFLGDNKSGRELVIPEENISSDEASGYVRSGDQPINIVNLITQEDIAAVMAQESGERVIINTIGRDIAAKKSTFRQVQEAARKRG